MPATQKKIRASVSLNASGENSAHRKSPVSAKRDTVSLFGRVIFRNADSLSARFGMKRRTSNIERPISQSARTANHWIFDVGCRLAIDRSWLLDVFHFSAPSCGQAVRAPSRPALVEHLRIRLHQGDEIFRLEHAERAAV